jgi:hypothetical protein
MIGKRNKKTTVQAEKVEAPIAPETTVVESQETTTPPVVESQETAPVLAVDTPAKAAKKRYANIAVLSNPNAVITYLAPNPKRDPNSKTHRKYNLFRVGMSVKEVEEAFVANNWPRMKARNQLRWDIEHGYVTLGVKEETPEEAKVEA